MPLPIIAPTQSQPGQVRQPLFAQPPGSQRVTQRQIERQRAMAESLLGQASNTGPAYGGTPEVLARALAGVAGTFGQRRADRDESSQATARAKALAQVLQGGDLGSLSASGDPELENMAFQMEMSRRQSAGDPPETRTVNVGQQQLTQRWDRERREWVTEFDAPRSVGGGGSRRPDLPRSRTRLDGEETIFEEFDDATGQWREVSRGPRSTSTRAGMGENLLRERIEAAALFGQEITQDQINAWRQEGQLLDQVMSGEQPAGPVSQFGLDGVRGQAGAVGAMPMPPGGAAALISGQVYETARGPARWDGTGFVPAQ